MTKRCKPIMTLLMIVIQSLMICKTEGTRTSKQLYLTPYHLSNGPIVPHLPYWTPYYHPMPLAYPSLYGQPFIDNTQFVKNQMGDFYSISPIERNLEKKSGRQRPFLTFLQNIFFGRPPTPCPSCPSCPANNPCAPCALTAAAAAGPTTFTTCDPNGYSVASSGTIGLTGLTDVTTVCEYFVAVQDPRAIARVSCSATNLNAAIGGAVGSVVANPETTLGGTVNAVIAIAGGTGVQIISSNFFGISITNKLAAGGSATCAWDVGSTTANSFTACVTDGFSSANAGTINLAGLPTGANCLYAIGVQVPIANVRVTCPTITLGTFGNTPIPIGTPPGATVTAEATPTFAGIGLGLNTPKFVTSNIAVIRVNNNRATGTTGTVVCNWDLGAATSAFVACTNTASFTTAATGTITLSNVANPQTCQFNIISPNNAATVTVKCTSISLGTDGSVIAMFPDTDVVDTAVTTTPAGVTSPSNYVRVTIANRQALGAAICSWSTNLP